MIQLPTRYLGARPGFPRQEKQTLHHLLLGSRQHASLDTTYCGYSYRQRDKNSRKRTLRRITVIRQSVCVIFQCAIEQPTFRRLDHF